MRKTFATLLAVGIAAIALAACGGGTDSGGETSQTSVDEGSRIGGSESGADGEGLDVEADPSGAFAYTAKALAAKAGKVTINFTNTSAAAHDVRIENANGEDIGGVEVISEGSNSSTVVLRPGEFTFFCSLEGHRQAGMEGTLKVD